MIIGAYEQAFPHYRPTDSPGIASP
jgi:hypothetical protein